jgi:hypothetical protein
MPKNLNNTIMKKPLKSVVDDDRNECPSSRSVLVRSLRRRLWKALQEEDVPTAMRAYLATKRDYELWLDEEICEEETARSKQEMMKETKLQVSHNSQILVNIFSNLLCVFSTNHSGTTRRSADGIEKTGLVHQNPTELFLEKSRIAD